MNNTYKTNKTDWRRLGRSILLVALLLGVALPAQARDYVITWTNGGTTYYVGMNGNNIAVKNEFDITCVWTCRNGNNNANLGGTSYSLRNKNNTTYFLTTSCSRSGNWNYTYTWGALTVQNSASNIWRSSDGTNGNVYAGEWEDGKKQGTGTYSYVNGAVYEGHFQADRYSGQGKMTYPSGNVYEGEWKDGKRNGQGRMTDVDGTVKEGLWENDQWMNP